MTVNLNPFSAISDTLGATKEVATGIAKVMGTIIDVLGFIGLRVLLLLLVTGLFLWFVNMVSPLSKKTNYFMGILVGLLIAIKANLSFNPFILKYLLIILLPFIASYVFVYLIRFSKFLTKKFILLSKNWIYNLIKKHKKQNCDFVVNIKKRIVDNQKGNTKSKTLNKKIHLSRYSGVSRFYKSIKY